MRLLQQYDSVGKRRATCSIFTTQCPNFPSKHKKLRMEGFSYASWKGGRHTWKQVGEDKDEDDEEDVSTVANPDMIPPALSLIPQPRTPQEPIEFLSRSWSISAEEIAQALSKKHKHLVGRDPLPGLETILEPSPPSPQPEKVMNTDSVLKTGLTIGKWFPTREMGGNGAPKKKDRARVDNSRVHTTLSIAGLAAALAAAAAAGNSGTTASKMTQAMASATELLASYCIETAETAFGISHDRITSVVRSAVDIQSAGDLMTLTAAAATALRGEATLRARVRKEGRRVASISPSHHKDIGPQETPCFHTFVGGELMQHTKKGGLQRKHVYVQIGKKSQVMIVMKSRHVGGAFSIKNKAVVYQVCETTEDEEVYFGLQTSQGFMEFKCKSKDHKNKWVDGISSLFTQIINSGTVHSSPSDHF